MQPNARKKSHRGIRRSEAPCSASNSHRMADRDSIISSNYMIRPGRDLIGSGVVKSVPRALLRSLFVWSFDLGFCDPAGDLRRARELRAIPSAAQRLNQLYGGSHRLGAKRSQVL